MTCFSNPKYIIFYGILLRLLFLLYGILQDTYGSIKYQDIDYDVYNDGAIYAMQGLPPYNRHTYRYTPLLAYLMIPNILLFPAFGKVIFCIVDIASVIYLSKLLRRTQKIDQKTHSILLSLWIFNPVVINVSTRGNADTLITLMVLVTIDLVLSQRYILAALIYGLCVHFKIYPILYSLPIYFYIDHSLKQKIFKIFTINRVLFALISAGVFLLLTGMFYYIYGYIFLYETYLYHFIRKDNRHNFSVYFYYIYLKFQSVSKIESALAFIPQFMVIIIAGVKFYKDLVFCMFVQTFFFVVFNKVCTAQYFVWYMVFFPLFFGKNKLFLENKKKLLFIGIIWMISELSWGVGSFLLETKGNNFFEGIWIICIIFFLINCWVGVQIIKNQQLTELKDIHYQEKGDQKKID